MERYISNFSNSECFNRSISAEDEMKLFCKRLPKVELNADLIGSLSMSTIVRIYDRHPFKESLDTYIDYYHSPKSLKRYNKLYEMNDWLLGTPESIKIAILDVCREFMEDNTFYLELRITPRSFYKILTKEEYIMAVIRAVRLSRVVLPQMIVKIIFSINRADDYVDCLDTCILILQYYKQHFDIIVGIQLHGDPLNDINYHQILGLCRKNRLKVIMNCAEIPNHTETWEMIDFKPDRLTHCTCVHYRFNGEDYLFDKLLRSKIPVELCLTYNVDFKNVPSYKDHHFQDLYRHHHPISICTRDKGICKTTLSEEYAIAAINFKLSKKDLLNLSKLSIKQSFIEEKELNILLNHFYRFEKYEIDESQMPYDKR